MILYKSHCRDAKTFYGETFHYGETKAVKGYIHDPKFVCVGKVKELPKLENTKTFSTLEPKKSEVKNAEPKTGTKTTAKAETKKAEPKKTESKKESTKVESKDKSAETDKKGS